MMTPDARAGRWALLAMAAAMAFLPHLALAAQTRPASQPAERLPLEVAQEKAARMTFLQLLLRGGWFMVPIGVASLLGLALVLERSLALRRGRVFPPGFMDELKAQGSDRDKALAWCEAHPSPVARVMEAGLRKLPQGEAHAEKALEDAGAVELLRLRRNLRMLYGVSAVAPMLGLLGTVWGMIEAFRVTASAHGLGRPELLATGIYEALVTTLAGLMVAIPVLMFYYYFTGRIEAFLAELNDAAGDLLDFYLPHRRSAAEVATTELNHADPRYPAS